MSRLATVGKVLIIGGLLALVFGTTAGGVGSPEAASLLVFGALLVGLSRFDVSLPGVKSQLALDRQDVVASTDWSRIGKYTLRSSFGSALAVSGGVLFVLSLALQEFSQAGLWATVAAAGVVVQAVSWRFAHEIAADRTHTISVRAPDVFSLHSFHIAVRQRAEDLGYRIVTNASPAESGSQSPIDDDVLHARGGFKARKRPIEDAKPLASELNDPYAERLLTVTTLGVFALSLGILVFSVGDELAESLPILGIPLALFGVAVIAYDYVTRTREWGELYCVEEGTAYATRTNEYADDVLEGVEYSVDPSVSSPATGAVLSVTVGAKCTSLYDEDRLESDFEELAEAVETAAAEFQSNALGESADEGPTVLTHTEPGTGGRSGETEPDSDSAAVGQE
ncbi:hypothetical protein [Natronobacterium lacisalsi]|uniref:hypothetical protein n=1 Tax=Natronobacterium lacisalsi TaxID=229731 RepID=UPI0012696D49|nr:hypothetical protein [Halobiforma lacisalsi]